MTFASSNGVHNLSQTSILLGKLIVTKKKYSVGPPRLRWSLYGVSLNKSHNNWWTTHPRRLFHTLILHHIIAHFFPVGQMTRRYTGINSSKSYRIPVVCPMSRLSQFRMASVESSLLSFVVDCHRLHSERGNISWRCS
jgi:hypothetical protein